MEELSPARFGLSRGRWANVRSLVLKALKVAGVTALSGRHVSRLSPDWQLHSNLLPTRPQRVNLSRFMHRCSESGIRPQEVTQDTFERFADEIEQYGLRARPHQTYREAVRAWNWAVENVPNWPGISIVVPDRRNRYSQPWESFAPSLKADVDAMLEASVWRCQHWSRGFRSWKLSSRQHRHRDRTCGWSDEHGHRETHHCCARAA